MELRNQTIISRNLISISLQLSSKYVKGDYVLEVISILLATTSIAEALGTFVV